MRMGFLGSRTLDDQKARCGQLDPLRISSHLRLGDQLTIVSGSPGTTILLLSASVYRAQTRGLATKRSFGRTDGDSCCGRTGQPVPLHISTSLSNFHLLCRPQNDPRRAVSKDNPVREEERERGRLRLLNRLQYQLQADTVGRLQ